MRVATTILSLVALLFVAPADRASAQGQGSSTEGAIFLLLPVGAKGVGVARAMTALGGAESVWWNPAGLAADPHSQILVTRGEDLSGETTTLSGIVRRPGLGSFAVSYLLMDVGEVALTDAQGNPLGTVSFRYHTGVLSGATRLFDRLALGMNLKLIQSRLTCRGECQDAGVVATTYAVDLGAQWSGVAGTPMTLAAALVHLGPDLQVVNEAQADPLPTRMRAAVAYDVIRHWSEAPDDLHARVAVELEDRWRDPGSPSAYFGMELAAGTDPGISLWVGYTSGAELEVDGAGVGIGIRFEQFDLGISKSLSQGSLNADTEPVNVTFGYVFR